jgi:autotransporter strand-loop-strand O-heptosyltransferase
LSWALNTKTILISGFSAPFSEFKGCERISPPPNACNSCYNKVRLDAGDWEWCPEYKDTDHQYECTKTILPSVVIKAIDRVRN